MGAAPSSLGDAAGRHDRVKTVRRRSDELGRAYSDSYLAPGYCKDALLVGRESIDTLRPLAPDDSGRVALAFVDDSPEGRNKAAAQCALVQAHYRDRQALLAKIAGWLEFYQQQLDVVLRGGYCWVQRRDGSGSLVQEPDPVKCGRFPTRHWQQRRPPVEDYDMDAPEHHRWARALGAFAQQLDRALVLAESFVAWVESNPGYEDDAPLRDSEARLAKQVIHLQRAYGQLLARTAGIVPITRPAPAPSQ